MINDFKKCKEEKYNPSGDKMKEVYLGLGSNVGEREQNLKQAVKLINDFSATEVVDLSSVYETEPWGYTDQREFLNLCLLIQTELAPYDLLASCQQVEEELDRKRELKWGPRTIDVDILVYDQLTLRAPDLILPHPQLTERAFVLVPLVELAPSLVVEEKRITVWLEEVEETGVNEYAVWDLQNLI